MKLTTQSLRTQQTAVRFVRFETDEGMAKKEENFTEKVAKQMAGD